MLPLQLASLNPLLPEVAPPSEIPLQPGPGSKSLFGRISIFFNPLKSIFNIWSRITHLFYPTPIVTPRPIVATPIQPQVEPQIAPQIEPQEEAPQQAPVASPVRQSRAVQEAAAMQIAQEATRANMRHWIVRTESLLNASPELEAPSQNPEAALERLSQVLGWRQASMAEYGPLIGQLDPAKQQALTEWNNSYNQLLKNCENDPGKRGPINHAAGCYTDLLNLPNQADATPLRYAGAFGKKQSMLQSLLLALPSIVYEQGPIAEELPRFLIDAVLQGAIGSPEALFSYGFDVLFNHLLETNPEVELPPSVESALKFLQPFLPNPKRESPLWTSIKSKLPLWIKGQGKDPIQQGLLCSLLELIPDSQATLRDECIVLLEKAAEGSRAPNRAACIAQWKPFLMRKVLTASALNFPISFFETLNGEAEDELSNKIQEIDPSLAALMTGQISSHGSYWLEWGYDRVKETYSLEIYASGAALTDLNYPRKGDDPIWPISLSNISLKTAAEKELISNLLKSMSKTTAITKHWQLPQENFAPLTASELFGKDGFVDQLKQKGAILKDEDATVIRQKDATFSPLDMASHYHAPLVTPHALRYQALKKALLEAVGPFTERIEDEPPRLVIPGGEQGLASLQLFEDASGLLHTWAQREKVSAKELREITAFEEQLAQVRQAHAAEADPSEQSLGVILDKCLESLAPAEGQTSFFTEYRDLLIFALGKDADGIEDGFGVSPAEYFVDLLSKRAAEIEKRPRSASIKRPVPATVNTFEQGWIRQGLQSPVVRTLWTIFCFLKRVKSLFSLGSIGLLPEVVRWVTPKFMHMKGMMSKGWIGLLPEALYTAGTYVVPKAAQDKIHAVYHSLYTALVSALRKQVFKFLFPKLENREFVSQMHEAVKPVLAHIPGVRLRPSKPFTLPTSALFSRLEGMDLFDMSKEVGGVEYSLINPNQQPEILQTLFSFFPTIDPLNQENSVCWFEGYEKQPVEGSRATILVTYAENGEEKHCKFVLECKNSAYQLLGMQDGEKIVYLASPEASKKWCAVYGASWAHFCPASSMRLLVDGETGHPMRCYMTSLDFHFALTQTADGWSSESATYPGFMIAKEQTVPLGLILENEAGEKKLILPQITLPHQILYAKVDPLLGILGSFAQSQAPFHKTDANLFHYTLTEGHYTSTDPFAMAHLLLFYQAHQKNEEFYQAGQDLLGMRLPKNLEMELLPLQFTSEPRAQQLYADLLAKIESDRFEYAAKGWIGSRLPNQVAQVVSTLNSLRTLARDSSEQLVDPVFHQIYTRYKRFLHLNRDQLGAALGWPKAVTLLQTDALALHLLPKNVAARARGLELSIGISSTWQDLGISTVRKMASMPTWSLFLLPIINQAIVSQSAFSRIASPAGMLVPSGLAGHACRAVSCFRTPGEITLSEQTLKIVSRQMHAVEGAKEFSQDGLVAYFLTYLAMTQGKFGNTSKQQIIEKLQAAQYAPEQHPTEKQLTKLLVTAGTNSGRFSIFKRLRNGTTFCKKLFKREIPAPQTRQNASLDTLNDLIAFKKAQPIMQRVESCGIATLSMIGTFYMLWTTSQILLASTVDCISPVVSTFTASDYNPSEEHTKMCANMVLSVAFTLFGTASAKKCVPTIMHYPLAALKNRMPTENPIKGPVKKFNRLTGLNLTKSALMTMAQVTLLMMQMQAVMAYVTPKEPAHPDYMLQHYPVPTVITSSLPEMDPFTIAAHLVGALPLIKMAYQAAQMMFIMQGLSVETIRKPRTVEPEIRIEELPEIGLERKEPPIPFVLEVD